MATIPVECAFGCLGLLIGVIYVFTGWSNVHEDNDLREQRRMRNLIWVVGGAIAILMSDMGFLFKNNEAIHKSEIFSYYCISVVVGTFGTLLVTSLLIWRRERSFSASIHYLHEGYASYQRHYGTDLTRAISLQAQSYSSILREIIKIHDKPHDSNAALRALASRLILAEILKTVAAHRGSDNLLGSNLMIAKKFSETDHKDRISYWLPDRTAKQPQLILELLDYSSSVTATKDLCLPVFVSDEDVNLNLPGAARAACLMLPQIFEKQDPKLSKELRNCGNLLERIQIFYTNKKVDTVLCLPITSPVSGGCERLGVVNIDSCSENFFGNISDRRNQLMMDALDPLLMSLAHIMKVGTPTRGRPRADPPPHQDRAHNPETSFGEVLPA